MMQRVLQLTKLRNKRKPTKDLKRQKRAESANEHEFQMSISQTSPPGVESVNRTGFDSVKLRDRANSNILAQFSRGFSKAKNALSKNIRSRQRVNSSASLGSLAGNIHNVDSSNENDHRPKVQMDPKVKEAFMALREIGVADTLDDAELIIQKLRQFPRSPEIQGKGLAYMISLALVEQAGLAAKGAVQVALTAIDNHFEKAIIVEQACVLIWNIGTDDTVLPDFIALGVPAKIVQVLQRYNSSGRSKTKLRPKLEKLGSKLDVTTPRSLIWNRKVTNKAAKHLQLSMLANQQVEQPIKSVEALKAMERRTTRVLHMACGAVKVIAANQKATAQMMELDVIHLVMSTFFYFCSRAPNDPLPQTTCISCLQNFCYGEKSDIYASKVFKAKGPEMIMRTMLKFKDNSDVQEIGCAAFWNICISSSEKADVVSEQHEDDSLTDSPSQEKMDAYTRRKEFAHVGAGTLAIAALKNWKENDRIVAVAMAALYLISKDDDNVTEVRIKAHANKKDLGLINIYDVIFAAYSLHEVHDHYIRRVGESLLGLFEMEDLDNLNREQILKQTIQHQKSKEVTEISEFETEYLDDEDTTHNEDRRNRLDQLLSKSLEMDQAYDINDPFGDLLESDENETAEAFDFV